ncbi:MAG TPA: pectate lyase [Puia sp.]|nr:pectate lyase [Puia sp.]
MDIDQLLAPLTQCLWTRIHRILFGVALTLLSFMPPPGKKIKVWLIGDSTMSDKEARAYPETGWGMPFAGFFDSTVTVDNRAKNGRSTKSFIAEQRWQSVEGDLKEGDYVLIQFGHNDEVPTKTTYTPEKDFAANLVRFITGSRNKKATPILITPVARRKFDSSGHIEETHAIYAAIVRQVAAEQQVPLIDLDKESQALIQQFEDSRLLFNYLEPGQNPNYPEGKKDDTHFSELGARKMAEIVLAGIRTLKLGLADRIAVSDSAPRIDPAPFADNAGHWYAIFDKKNIISPLPDRPRYKPAELTNIADNILLFQKTNGGWPKNYDIFAILTDSQKDSVAAAKSLSNTTFDNGSTYTQITALAIAYSATHTEKYKTAAIKGLDFILQSQYKNGGWPQYYPLEAGYSRCITYNDGVMEGIMKLLKDIKENNPRYAFVDAGKRAALVAAYAKGLTCILRTQINDAGTPTAWCQQYDEVSLKPAWARKFEPPSICNKESAGIVLFLMSIEHPDKEITAAIQNAVAWFAESRIYNTRIRTIPAPRTVTPFRVSVSDKVAVTDSTAPPIWTRYYELKTHRPIFCNRDSKIVYSLAEVQRERRDGYGWYTYDPQKVLDQYPAWQKKSNPAPAVVHGPQQADPQYLTVAQDGSGDYTTVQAALDAIPLHNTRKITLFIKNGLYREKLHLDSTKDLVTLIGEDQSNTILTYDDHPGKVSPQGDSINTRSSYSFLIRADEFSAQQITFRNDAGFSAGQAVALEVQGDRARFSNCRIVGNQDILFLNSDKSRQYYQNCYIEGTTDFIFGAATAWFSGCRIHSKKNSHLTAASTPQEHLYGFVFYDCTLTGDTSIHNASLGRPWRPYASVTYLHCYIGPFIRPEGWSNWNNTENYRTARYSEYRNYGPGSDTTSRVSWSHQLTDAAAQRITFKNIFGDWNPESQPN